MKQLIKRLKVYVLTFFSFLFIAQKAYAMYTRYTLTAIFYDDDAALEKFINEGLEYEFKDINSNDNVIGFSEKIPNPLKCYGMNTIHNLNTTKTITKLIPIDSRKIKTMEDSERIKIQELLKICMAGIILFDYSDSRLDIFQDFWTSRDCKKFLEYDFTFNHVFKLMGSVKWGNFVGVYTYNASKLTKEQWDRQYTNIVNYMRDLERFFGVDNRWTTRRQTEKVESAFKTISDSASGTLGSSTELIRNEPLVKKYLVANGIVIEPMSTITASSIQSEPIRLKLEEEKKGLAKQLQEHGEFIETKTNPQTLKIPSDFLGVSPQILIDEIRTLEEQILKNEIEIENLIKTTKCGFDKNPYKTYLHVRTTYLPVRTDSLNNEELCRHIKKLEQELQEQENYIKKLEDIEKIPWYKRLFWCFF